MERIGELKIQPRPEAMESRPATRRFPVPVSRLWSIIRRKRRPSDDDNALRRHPALLFANDKEIARYAADWRSYDRDKHVPVSTTLLRRW